MMILKRPTFWVPLLLVGLGVARWLGSPLFLVTRVNEGLPAGAMPAAAAPMEAAMAPKEAAMAPKEAAMAPLTGSFVDGDSFHKASGKASVLQTGAGQLVLRLEDFKVTNGPDLFVVLAEPAGKAGDGVRLGALKGSEGSHNYEIPAGTDLMKYSRVIIWCRAFNVVFGTADLAHM